MSRLLITGATGFIGRACLPLLLEAGHDVHAVSRQVIDNGDSSVQWHEGDVLCDVGIDHVIREVRASHCLHLAWTTEPGVFWTTEENLDWMRASLRLARCFVEAGGERFVVAGSCTEYMLNHSNCDESSLELAPQTLYSRCKHSLHLILDAWARQSQREFAWGRVFYPYGPDQEASRIVPTTIRSLLNIELATCRTPHQVRDFIPVQDVAAAFVRLVECDAQGCFNICTGTGNSVLDILRTTANILGREELVDPALESVANDTSQPEWVGQPHRLRDECDWRPRFDLRRGIEQTVDHDRAREAACV